MAPRSHVVIESRPPVEAGAPVCAAARLRSVNCGLQQRLTMLNSPPFEVLQSEVYLRWFKGLRDRIGCISRSAVL
jgi:hypothetical protein